MTLKAIRVRFALFLTMLVAAVGMASTAQASVPGTLTQQGRLLDSSGMPITNSVAITFTLYDAGTGGTNLWTETITVTPDDGYFSVQLGAMTAFGAGVFDGSTRYLGVTVGSDPEMTPRETVSSVPYAFHAGSADTAASADTVAWTGITGFPAPCTAPQFLSGYDTAGNPVCTSPQALSCTTRYTATSGTSSSASCQSGELLTGGGCSSNGTLTSAYPYACTSGTLCVCAIGGPCFGSNDYLCYTSGATSVTAFARCCHLQ